MNDVSTLDERYFVWLYSQIADEKNRNPANSHWLLCERLFKKEFTWFIHNDDNRLAEGIEIRQEFLDETGEQVSQSWFDLECSFFEMLIGLCRRASFQTDWRPDEWFWKILDNLEIGKYNDNIFHDAIGEAVDGAIDRVINRTYESNGIGGLFPLRDPERDQREVELWYQLSAYLLENVVF